MQSPSHDETRYFQALVQEAETFLSAVWTRLREAREARGWSMEKTAELLGVDEKTYKHWERKRHHPQFDHFQALVELFGLEALTSHQERAFLAFLARLDGATRKAFYQYLAALPDLAWMRQFLKYVEQLPRDEQIP